MILLTGCSSISFVSRTDTPLTKPLWKGGENEEIYDDLYTGAKLIEISYYQDYQEELKKKNKNTSGKVTNNDDGQEIALKAFNARGLDATYFSPDTLIDPKYPEVFILSQRRSNAITLLFVGTNSFNDWIQNAKSTNYEDIPFEGNYYIPAGHAGFRRGIFNLINMDFFNMVIDDHVKEYDVSNNSGEKIKVHLIGHSQGGGIAQLIAPAVEGCVYKNENIDCEKGKYIVDKIFAYGVPYAVSTFRGEKDWDYMNDNYGQRTYMVLKDSDLVAAVYNALKYERTVPARHFGKFVRITRDNDLSTEEIDWGKDLLYKDQPHYIKNYKSALEKAISKKNKGRLD